MGFTLWIHAVRRAAGASHLPPLSHDELVQLQRIAAQAGSLLIWIDKDVIWRAPPDGRPGRPVVFLRCGHPVLPVDQDPFQAAIPPDLRDGGSPAEVGGAALARAGLLDAVAQAKDPDRADPLSPCGWPAEPAGPLSGHRVAMPCRAVDGAYDTRRCHTAILARDATPIILIRKNGRACKEDCQPARARNETLRATRYDGRAFWKRWTGYHARIRIEAKPLIVCSQTTAGQWMRCLKAFGERIAVRDPDRQTAQIQIRIALINRFNALGTAEIIRVA